MPAPQPDRERRMLGIGLRCLSASGFAIMGAALKIASLNGANLVELIFYRSVAGIIPVGCWVLWDGGRDAIRIRDPKAHVTRSVIGLVAMTLAFGALALLPLAQATTLTYMAPITATVLSALFLRERVGPRRWTAVLVGFGGVILVAFPFGNHVPIAGVLIGLLAAIGQGAVAVTLRQIAGRETTTSIVFWFTMATTIAAAILMPVFARPHDTVTLLVLAGSGLAAGIAQICSTASLRFAPVSVVVPFDYLQILWATLIGWLLLGSAPPGTLLIGAALVIASGVYTAYRERRLGRIAS